MLNSDFRKEKEKKKECDVVFMNVHPLELSEEERIYGWCMFFYLPW